MQRLLYISTSRSRVTQPVIDEILRVSRRNNAAAGVTGLLIAGGNRFLQVLEGDDLAVSRTFDRIQRDDRHFAMVQLAKQTIDERSFGSWSMGFASDRGADCADRGSDATRLFHRFRRPPSLSRLSGLHQAAVLP
jgi:hypothetical protein